MNEWYVSQITKRNGNGSLEKPWTMRQCVKAMNDSTVLNGDKVNILFNELNWWQKILKNRRKK